MHLVQVGVGSGGIAVLDLIARDDRVTRLTLLDPDVYQAHNVHRHLFPAACVGRLKVELAAEWVAGVRPGVAVEAWPVDVTAPAEQGRVRGLVAGCDVSVCAVDGERAKYHFDELFRRAGRPWTLGEVLSGGVGGWVHRFVPGGPCYGCVASHLQRAIPTAHADPAAPPADYADPAHPVPANKASVAAVAALHALATLELLAGPASAASWLMPLTVVSGVFPEPFRGRRLTIPRDPACLVCADRSAPSGAALDAAVDDALGRLG